MTSAHIDTFARDNLPPKESWPDLIFTLDELQYPAQLNAAARLVDDAVAEGYGDKIAIRSSARNWSYLEVQEASNRVAGVLVNQMGLVSGNRVLLRGPNNAMLAICWLGVLKAGGIAVTTMPMLRAAELKKVIDKAEISHALCDKRLAEELDLAAADCPDLSNIVFYGDADEDSGLEKAMTTESGDFRPVPTASDDVALLAFTSGTTGNPKACMHFHRDILAMADTFSRHIVQPNSDDVFAGTPPLAFTFGLGAVLVFPFAARASTVLDETPSPVALLESVDKFGVTALFTAPTAYRAMLGEMSSNPARYELSTLKKCVSAGEALPKATSDAWHEGTGIRLIDGIGATELIHIFISASGEDIRPGSTGKPVPGYEACVLDDNGTPLPAEEVGRLAVKGPTGCRYLDDARQTDYVQNGWNITGDSYRMDDDGYFWFVARSDDMIISGGYNISGPEVENALLEHSAVAECAVVGWPDEDRGHIVKAFVVLGAETQASDDLKKELQDHVKSTIAPYKYPRAIEFTNALPKTQTGKIKRFELRK